MSTEMFEDLLWEVDDYPICFSTPDDLFQWDYRARTTCPEGHQMLGTAHYRGTDESGIDSHLSHISYELCDQCVAPDEEEPFDDEEEFDEE